MIESSKQVRVDNWGVFFLQRLQMFFSKTDYCDLTLQFQGNVQLKVHRLVMNACTEYFTFLEQSCPSQEDNTILMPPDLQADVIVPIVNFMYTGMLEFHISIFEKLYNVAELMDITVLTKLLDAQKVPMQGLRQQKKKPDTWTAPKKPPPKTATPELPPTLPGRKLPVWKRKNVPSSATSNPSTQMNFIESNRWTPDPLSMPDNAPKPTRFEWPDDDLPPINLMDTSFEEISYTSRPLLTQEEENRAGTSFDEVRNNASSNSKKVTGKTSSGGNANMTEVDDYAKEHRITVDFSTSEEGEYEFMEVGQKRKQENAATTSPKRQKLNDKENKETTISVKSNNGAELDHTKIVSQILKKYPQLVKKNKNIRLKIMASGNKNVTEQKVSVKTSSMKTDSTEADREKSVKPVKQLQQPDQEKQHSTEEGPWTCNRCTEAGEVAQEFVLYYLYRKHMTDVHNEAFDLRLCKYCGRKCGKHNLMMYHLYTKHGLKPPASYNFPKCDQCPFIALSVKRLNQHKLRHGPNEMTCLDCKLTFASQQALTSHMRVTGHYNKTGKSSYDCQYCTKKLQSAINLFSHIKNSHLKEARRSGIVSLDEMDDVNEANEEEEEQEEEQEQKYIMPEMIQDAIQKDKVKIISNVKVPGHSDQAPDTEETVPLVPSSEAESLNNVASGIATSLGLVDIVVLDENQQYILQQQENQGEQTEYILPELAPGENYTGQVITTQHSTVLQQGMLQSSASDIGSTDELVMVLTDHDYQDDQEGGATDNSNIVVLYSHPVDGQQGQFITSQGNLLVNSQTGMLEIRNSAAIATTTANEIVVNNEGEAPIESIEMIQREIESHSDIKQDLCYNTAKNTEVQQKSGENSEQPEEHLILNEIPNEPSAQEQEEAENEGENETENTETEQEPETQNEDSSKEQIEETEEPEENQDAEPKQQADEGESQDKVDGTAMDLEEPMEIEEIEPTSEQDTTNELNTEEEEEEEASTEQEASELPVAVTADAAKTVDKEEVEESLDVPPERPSVTISLPVYGISQTAVINDPNILQEVPENKSPNEAPNGSLDDVPEEPMEVDGEVKEQQPQEEEAPVAEVVEKEPDEAEAEEESQEAEEESQEAKDDEKDKEVESEAAPAAADSEPQTQLEEVSDAASEYQQQSETSIDDDNSQSSQEQAQTTESQSSINQTILDDWEDTDSQHSEKQKAAMKEAAENVNKLMDDWGEEEEEDDKKEAD